MVSVKELQDVVDDLKDQAGKRAAEIFGEGKTEVRRAIGGHSDATLLGGIVLGLLLGAIAGAAIALLFAPFTGVEARKKIGEGMDKVRSESMTKAGNGSTRPVSPVGTPPFAAS